MFSDFFIFFDDDVRDSTSTTSRCFFDDVVHYSRPVNTAHMRVIPAISGIAATKKVIYEVILIAKKQTS